MAENAKNKIYTMAHEERRAWYAHEERRAWYAL